MTVDRAPRARRQDYRVFRDLPTRVIDNDIYGHMNNVVYYALIDTVVNSFLIDRGVLDMHGGDQIGVVVETGCRYHSELAYPHLVQGGLKVTRIGNSSVRYEVGLFREGEEMAAADGFFVHVYIDRRNRRPLPVRPELRAVLEEIVG
jgi:acyl-CoA thioester hydrolase